MADLARGVMPGARQPGGARLQSAEGVNVRADQHRMAVKGLWACRGADETVLGGTSSRYRRPGSASAWADHPPCGALPSEAPSPTHRAA